MTELKGFDSKYRRYFSKLAGNGAKPFTIKEAALLLNVPYDSAKKILNRLARSGWLYRIKKGLYIAASPTVTIPDQIVEDPWILANSLFDPCYIGGWDAISFWDYTDQIFIHTFVYTTCPQKKSTQTYLGHTFIVRKIPKEDFFGLKTEWRNNVKIKMSDPSRTIIDLLEAPQQFGGSSVLNEILTEYLRSDHKNIPLLVDYALAIKNKAVIKRLGYLLERKGLLSSDLNTKLLANLSPGKVKLVPTQDCSSLVTKWQLWIPREWKDKRE